MDPRTAGTASSGKSEMQNLEPQADPLNQKLWGGAQQSAFHLPPDDPDACSSLRTAALKGFVTDPRNF